MDEATVLGVEPGDPDGELVAHQHDLVAAGRIALGDPALAVRDWDGVLDEVDRRIADAVDRVKLARGDVPLIAVGGGSHLVADHVPGASEVLRPRDFDVANAIGAAHALTKRHAFQESTPEKPVALYDPLDIARVCGRP